MPRDDFDSYRRRDNGETEAKRPPFRGVAWLLCLLFGIMSLMTLVSISAAVYTVGKSIDKISQSVSQWDVQFNSLQQPPYYDQSSRSLRTK